MTEVTEQFYSQNTPIKTLTFAITAKRYVENYANRDKKHWLLWNNKTFEKMKQYQQGTLYLKNTNLHFKKAFWSQGKLILKNVSGFIHQQKCNAPEVVFNKRNMALTSNKITLFSSKKISKKINYSQQVEPVVYPYQKGIPHH